MSDAIVTGRTLGRRKLANIARLVDTNDDRRGCVSSLLPAVGSASEGCSKSGVVVPLAVWC